MSTATELLTARRKADRQVMALQVVDLASEYKLAAWYKPEEPGSRLATVDLLCPLGLRLTVKFDGSRRGAGPDTYVLSWHGVQEGARLHPGMFGDVNRFHGRKATDVAHGFAQLLRILRERFAVIRDGSAFIPAAPAPGSPPPPRLASQNTKYVRYHPAEHMTGLHELRGVTEPAAVVLRPDGSADVYGHVAVVDQRPDFREPAGAPEKFAPPF